LGNRGIQRQGTREKPVGTKRESKGRASQKSTPEQRNKNTLSGYKPAQAEGYSREKGLAGAEAVKGGTASGTRRVL